MRRKSEYTNSFCLFRATVSGFDSPPEIMTWKLKNRDGKKIFAAIILKALRQPNEMLNEKRRETTRQGEIRGGTYLLVHAPKPSRLQMQRMEKLKGSKSGRKKFKFLSRESLLLRLGDNQVLQFYFPKDTTSRLHNNKAFSLPLSHTRCPRPPNRSTHFCLFPSFHTYRNP